MIRKCKLIAVYPKHKQGKPDTHFADGSKINKVSDATNLGIIEMRKE